MDPETQIIFEKLLLDRGLVKLKHLARAKRHQVRSREKGETVDLLELLIDQRMGDPPKLRDAARAARQQSGVERVNIGGFELMEQVGRGGMGAVYRATQVKMGRAVALKLMRPRLAKDSRYLERFLREARACARLSHPNIVQAIDAGEDKGYYYFAMEFVDGDSLRRLIGRDSRLPESRCVQIAVETAQALDHASRFGLVHRDVKPENILIERTTGTAKLADLGLVKSKAKKDTSVTQTGVAVGTPNYISPEQARGRDDVDVRSDIYSLGATLYFAATGTLPFTADTPPVLMSKHISEPLDPPHARCPQVSRDFSQVIQKMMAKKPEDRYQTAAELRDDLQRLARGEKPRAASTPRPARTHRVRTANGGRRKTRSRLAVAAFAAVALLVLGGLAAGLAAMLSSSGRGDEPAGDAAETHFRVAAALIRKSPTRFDDITKSLQRHIAQAPDGPRADLARKLFQVAQQFRDLRKIAVRKPRELADLNRKLDALAAESPEQPAYGPAILSYRETLARRILDRVRTQSIENPTRVPGALEWVEVIDRTVPDASIRHKARSTRERLREILATNAKYLFEQLRPAVDALTREGRFGEAVRILRSKVPASLMTPNLQTLIEGRLAGLEDEARRHVKVERQRVWQLLDSDALERARDVAQDLVDRLGMPELDSEARAILATAQEALRFRPSLVRLSELKKTAPKDLVAVGRAALSVRKEFGSDPYVASRLKPYAAAIKHVRGADRIDALITRATTLLRSGKAQLADQAIQRVLDDPAATEAQRTKAIRLRVQLGPRPALVSLLQTSLRRRVPVEHAAVRIHGEREPVDIKITAATAEGLAYEREGAAGKVPWSKLPVAALVDLACGSLKLVADDDPNGLYYVGAVCCGTDDAAARKYLRTAVELATARTKKEFPERAMILRSAGLLLAQIDEAAAEQAFIELTRKVSNAKKSGRQVDETVAAWETFHQKHGAGPFVKAHEADYAKVREALSDAVFSARAMPALRRAVAAQWDGAVPRFEQTLAETDRIHPLDKARREALAGLIDFGRRYAVEKLLFDAVFRHRPWRGEKLAALLAHKNEAVVERAKRYAKLFKHDVPQQDTADDQFAFATHEQRGPQRVYIHDVDVRLARYNAVFEYWRRKTGDHSPKAEIRVASDIRHTGRGGCVMAMLMMEDFVAGRRALSREMRAEAEYSRLDSMIQAAGSTRPLLKIAVGRARELMKATAGSGEFPARFCLMVAEQSERLGENEDALRHYELLIDPRSRHREFAWRGYLGRGRLREAGNDPKAALADYERALRNAKHWHEAHRCAEHIVNLCIRSGKLNNRGAAERAVNAAAEMGSHPDHVKRTRDLLK
jgi:serine/threonine-protein kinase